MPHVFLTPLTFSVSFHVRLHPTIFSYPLLFFRVSPTCLRVLYYASVFPRESCPHNPLSCSHLSYHVRASTPLVDIVCMSLFMSTHPALYRYIPGHVLLFSIIFAYPGSCLFIPYTLSPQIITLSPLMACILLWFPSVICHVRIFPAMSVFFPFCVLDPRSFPRTYYGDVAELVEQ